MTKSISRKPLKTSRKPHLLILEDDRWLADSLCASLAADFAIDLCYNPNEIFAKLSKTWPDVMLADMILGSQNLFTLLNELSSYDDSRNVPIMIVTSAAAHIQPKDLREFNVKAVLDKATMTPKSLRETLKTITGKAEK